jgi:hypothetical protein
LAAEKASTPNRPRGRPPIGDDDPRIGAAVHQLMLWGFSRDPVCDAVAQAARKILGRSDHKQLALSGKRIEQLYEAWLLAKKVRPQRWKYEKNWLNDTAPTGTVAQLAEKLVRGDPFPKKLEQVDDIYGTLDVEVSDYMLHGDPELTPRGAQAEAELFAPFRKK